MLVLLLCGSLTAMAQTVVKGKVIDASSKSPLTSVSVFFRGGRGVITSTDGTYTIKTSDLNLKEVEYSFVGYKTTIKKITPGKEQQIDIELQPTYDLNEVVVSTNKRAKYRNKNNPAVELIRKVIDNKSKNRESAYDYVQYQEYQKMELSLTKRPEKLLKSKLFKNFSFVLENEDTSKIEGKALLPVYLDEKLSQKYYRRDPQKEKAYILGEKRVDYGEFIDNSGVNSYLNRLYQDVDVYENNINIMTTQFLSPIADLAPTFYMFYIRDTVEQDGIKLVKMAFYPRNPNDLLFKGTMFITLDGNYAVQKITFTISKNANLNWTKDLKINQDFERGPDGRYHRILSNMLVEFSLTQGSKGSIIGERTVSLKDYIINKPAADTVYQGPAEVAFQNITSVGNDSFWIANRHQPLSEVESKVYTNIDSLKNMKSFRRLMDWLTLLLAGYKQMGPNYELGPVSTFYSFNPVEGFRLRAGGRTTPNFSKNIFFENYLAYGFKDEKWKYYLAATYSFNHKSIYSFPLNYLRFSYQRDTKIPGQELQFVQEDNFLLSFKRGNNDKWLYNNIFKAEYVREFSNRLSYTLGFKNWKQTPAGAIVFDQQNGGDVKNIPNVTTTELSAELRWAPHEKFYQGKIFRIPIINEYPIFRLRYIAGIKGLAGGEYNYHNLNLTIDKRFYLAQLGYTDVTVEGGKIFGNVPFPLLTVHRANQSFSYQLNAYNLMNFMEFISDRYVGINVDHYFNGFIFNKIPLFKKLKWREVITAKVLYGGISDQNNPAINKETFKFPVNTVTGLPTTYILNDGPYVEVSAGITNIFRLLRIDLVKRLTYLNNPDVSQWGIRSRIKFDF
ncbi:DUF5686 and carboxypeptidase-like regulatory domain-containing protein [Foetidibacter luteolus]|uniref:DUF5686 and carboxypeptidase-like regulatory domain-containing protein n=1 Tax=Foetidibacter luteolus TaxID=2608880 RepID=UPI001F48A943|nr:DUF5686 and carboxypeptidase-like regulatory domain-containing protein [Foetidibacter luteolus]